MELKMNQEVKATSCGLYYEAHLTRSDLSAIKCELALVPGGFNGYY